MTDPTRPPMLAADHIRELTRTHPTRDKIDRYVPIPNTAATGAWTRIRETVTVYHDPLLDQLEQATTNTSGGGAYGGGSAASKPAARLDAIAVLQRIDRGSATLATTLGIPAAPMRRRLGLIAGKVGSTLDPAVAAWWVAARCATGWETPAYAPDVPCPNMDCERWSTLRIRLTDGIGHCIECGATWQADQFSVLGDYIRWASEHLRGARHWKYDAEGYPIECVECLGEREAMAVRKCDRSKAPNHGRRHAHAVA